MIRLFSRHQNVISQFGLALIFLAGLGAMIVFNDSVAVSEAATYCGSSAASDVSLTGVDTCCAPDAPAPVAKVQCNKRGKKNGKTQFCDRGNNVDCGYRCVTNNRCGQSCS